MQQYCNMNYHSKLGDNIKFIIIIIIIITIIINAGKIGSWSLLSLITFLKQNRSSLLFPTHITSDEL